MPIISQNSRTCKYTKKGERFTVSVSRFEVCVAVCIVVGKRGMGWVNGRGAEDTCFIIRPDNGHGAKQG